MKLSNIYDILFKNKEHILDLDTQNKIKECYEFLNHFSKDKVIYGINTGFGPMAQYRVEEESLKQLQYNIIRSHASGAGEPIPPIYIKAAMITRLQTFAQCKSGVHPELIELLQNFINLNITPLVPQHGSVGASGDLVQLAHIALTLIGEGEVFYKGELHSTESILKLNNLKPLDVHIREGLALTNGTSVMTGIGLVNVIYANKLMKWSLLASVMMNEIASSYDDFMSEFLNDAKHHEGQRVVAKTMRDLAKGSNCVRNRKKALYNDVNTEKIFKHKVQPYYSLRCIPQILGPIYDELKNAEKVLVNELNSASDNPIIDIATENIYHGGNFHGDYVSFEMDKLKIAITKLTMLSERQMNYLFHDKINGILPPFVNLGVLGLNYGLQAAQFTATSTTAECQTLSNPMYVHSIPNNNDNQDIVSMGTNSALLAKTVIENSFQVMAIHFLAIVQAVDCLGIQDKMAQSSQDIYHQIRALVPVFKEDTPKYKEIRLMIDFLKETELNQMENL